MHTISRTPDAALFTYTTVIQLEDGNVGTRILLADINWLIIGSLYMYADEDTYHNDPSDASINHNWLSWTRTV